AHIAQPGSLTDPRSPPRWRAVAPADDRVLVFAEPGAAREAAARGPDREGAKPLRPALQRAAGKHALVAGLRSSPQYLAQRFAWLAVPRDADAVARFRGLAFTLDVTPADVTAAGRRLDAARVLEDADDAQAQAARP